MNRPAILTLFLILLSSSALRAADVKVTFVTPSIVRVQWSPDGQLPGNATGVCIYSPHQVAVRQTRENGCRVLRSSLLKVSVDLKTTAITFTDRKTGRVLLEETQRRAESVIQTRTVYDDRTAHAEQTANGQVTVKKAIRTDTLGHSTRFFSSFACPGTKALYGLGSHMEDYMNLLGKTLWLTQHNLKITIPVLVSPQGYGLLFDVGCAMKYTSSGHTFSMQMEAARQLDYYFIAGKRLDDVVGGYRYLTGRVELLPRYAFGYIQSKERYTSSAELIATVREYRRRHVPLDMIVQDWNYWPQGWGYMKMDPRFYPSPKALADTIHSLHAKLMVSIWPNPQYCPEADDFRKRGYMLEH